MAQDYRNLEVWQKAISLTVPIYKLTKVLPKEEIYGLTSQKRRASISIASNIAEGRGRLNRGEFLQFLGIAQGSTYELQTQLTVAKSLHLANSADLEEASLLSDQISRMLSSFIRTLQSAPNKKTLAPRSKEPAAISHQPEASS